jgi:hypothetical protein
MLRWIWRCSWESGGSRCDKPVVKHAGGTLRGKAHAKKNEIAKLKARITELETENAALKALISSKRNPDQSS